MQYRRIAVLPFTLLLALGLGACASAQEKDSKTSSVQCADEALTGSNIQRMTCRPTTTAQERAAAEEEVRRAQQRSATPPSSPDGR